MTSYRNSDFTDFCSTHRFRGQMEFVETNVSTMNLSSFSERPCAKQWQVVLTRGQSDTGCLCHQPVDLEAF